ncbi:MAG TPA: HTTM domain-containing protein, partial [Pirellulaceae bacterium]
MNPITKSLRDWAAGIAAGWNNFWFTSSLPHTLALVRICGGAMLLYTHVVWTLRLGDFVGPNSWLNADTSALLNRSPAGANYAWSYLYYIESPALLWALHFAGLVVFAMLTVGWYTRVVAVLAWMISVSYVNRLTGTLFGLDQINVFIATYLMVGDSGGVWSVDRWLARRRMGGTGVWPALPRIDTNIAIRLLQLHMCVIYLFGGIHKMRGETWWDGSALWYAFASLEYQSIDMLWTAKHR